MNDIANEYEIGGSELKIRGWNQHDKKMVYYDDLDVENGNMGMIFAGEADVKPVVMLFSGRHDRDGKEIYEGDIVSSPVGETGVVLNREYRLKNEQCHDRQKVHTGWCVKKAFGFYSLAEHVVGHTCCLVIGNIFENPNLLDK